MEHKRAVKLIKAHTGYTGPAQDHIVDAIAQRMVSLGEGVWHDTAQVTQKPCMCFTCRPVRLGRQTFTLRKRVAACDDYQVSAVLARFGGVVRMEKRFAAVCFVCKALHTAVLPADAHHTPKARVSCACGERLTMHPVAKAKSYRKAPHVCNASCQSAAHFTECNCECGGVNHGRTTSYSAGPVHVH